MRNAAVAAAIVAASVTTSLLLAEAVSRLVFPISSGAVFRPLEGDHPHFISGPRMGANLRFRQVSTEYDVITTTTADGNRRSHGEGPPTVIFLGDSFTFGTGLSDEETFPHIFCRERNMVCANLGRPGLSTADEVRVLKHYLEVENWRPREVKLFLVAMTSSLMPGNDLYDNHLFLLTQQDSSQGAEPTPQPSLDAGALLSRVRRFLITNSNLARVALYGFGPRLRALTPRADKDLLAKALAATRNYVDEIRALGDMFGFALSIYIVHPLQDIVAGTYLETEQTLVQHLAGVGPVSSTARALLPDPARYYYSFDGHLNPAGSRAIAGLLLSEFETTAPR
jgi:hypothetical protein